MAEPVNVINAMAAQMADLNARGCCEGMRVPCVVSTDKTMKVAAVH
jgi:hypothetical protein